MADIASVLLGGDLFVTTVILLLLSPLGCLIMGHMTLHWLQVKGKNLTDALGKFSLGSMGTQLRSLRPLYIARDLRLLQQCQPL